LATAAAEKAKMGILLEIREGPMAGKVVGLKTGEAITIGRAAGRAQFALPHDTFMSGLHFAVECGPQGCRVQDRKSSNGTFLNGARIQDAMLANGDEIKSGQSIFKVKIVADAKLASLLPPQDVAPQATPPPRPPAAAPAHPHAEPAPNNAVQDPRPAARVSPAEPSPPIMRTADLDQDPEVRPTRDAAVEQAAPQSSEAPALPPGRGLRPKPEPPPRSVPPPVQEPPRFHAIPSVPRPGGSPANPGANPPRAVENPPGALARPPRVAEPSVGVAPDIAQKFAERPVSGGAGSSRGVAFSVMGWSFPAAPVEWQVQEGFGLQQLGHEEFPSSVAATEELLGGITLQQFVESQISMLRGYLRDPKIEPTMPPRVGGADESMAVDVRHSTKDGRELVYRRIYARSGESVGVLTVTTPAADLPQVLLSLQPLLDGAAFRSTVVHNG
jgi:pSer/pThr/pTyr-binding forkhead associated (FHA) protein